LKKKAVVLLITIAFITVITAIVYETMAISKSSLDDVMLLKRQNQLMSLVLNTKKMIKQMNSDVLDEFLNSNQNLPLQDEKSGLSLSLSCFALKSKFDLNKFLKHSENEDYRIFKNNFLDKYELSTDFWQFLKANTPFPTLKKIEIIKDEYIKNYEDFNINKITQDELAKYFYVSDLNITINSNDLEKPSDAICELLDNVDDTECEKKFKSMVRIVRRVRENNQTNRNNQINIKNLIECKINLYNGDNINSVVFKFDRQDKNNKIVSIDEFF